MAYRNKVYCSDSRTVDSEIFNLSLIIFSSVPDFSRPCMVIGAGCRKFDICPITFNPACLTLYALELSLIVFYDKVIPEIVTIWDQNVIAYFDQSRNNICLAEFTNSFVITL